MKDKNGFKSFYSIYVGNTIVERIWGYNKQQRIDAYKFWYAYSKEINQSFKLIADFM